MQKLLFLPHRIPFPPNKGDKIRSYNLLRYLAEHYEIYLGTFIDDPQDWQYLDDVKKFCADVHAVTLNPKSAKLHSLVGFLRDEALTLPYYRNKSLQHWVDQIIRDQNIEQVLVFSSAMAQYVNGVAYQHLHRVIDFVDIDSDKWHQYSRSQSWPMSWVYRREGDTLQRFEFDIARDFAASVFVSSEEAALFQRLLPEAETKITYASNGVDTDFFNPEKDHPNPYSPDEKVLVFTGAMDYWANVDAVSWFAKEIFPQIRESIKNASFYIVGSRPTPVVLRLNELAGVTVTGSVAEIPPYIAHAELAVAPLRIARGIQNKVLEAMAMAKPVVATSAAMDGIAPCDALKPLITDTPKTMAEFIIRLLKSDEKGQYGQIGRDWVLKHYHWDSNLHRIKELLQGMPINNSLPVTSVDTKVSTAS